MNKEDEMRKHYQKLKIQPDFYSAENDLGWREGNIIKYVTRYKLKGTPIQDLLKARDYLDRMIEKLEIDEKKRIGRNWKSHKKI